MEVRCQWRNESKLSNQIVNQLLLLFFNLLGQNCLRTVSSVVQMTAADRPTAKMFTVKIPDMIITSVK